MTDLDALLLAILDPANDGDDALRLAYADLLEEAGQTERAEFVRVQVRLADIIRRVGRCTETQSEHICCRFCDEGGRALRRRERELLARNTDWALPAFPGVCRLRRGFVEHVTCTAADWLAHADAILAVQPVREAQLTTEPEIEWKSGRPGDGRLCRLRGKEKWTDHLILSRMSEHPTRALLAAEWPHVRFTLPPDPADAFRDFTGLDVLRAVCEQFGLPAHLLNPDTP